MSGPKIYYIRHGETDWNAQKRFQGKRDIPLNPTGQAQADANGVKMASLLKDVSGIDFFSSPLGRARETMERVRTGMGLVPTEYEIEPLLIERSYGDFEGVRLADIKINDNKLHRERKADRWGFTPKGGESHDEVCERVAQWYSGLKRDCVVAAHGAVGRVLRYYLLDLDADEAGLFTFPQDQICIIQKGRERFI